MVEDGIQNLKRIVVAVMVVLAVVAGCGRVAPEPQDTEVEEGATVSPLAVPPETSTETVSPTPRSRATSVSPLFPTATATRTLVVTASPTTAPTSSPSPTPKVTTPAASAAGAPRTYETTIAIPTYDYAAAFVETAPDDAVYPYPRLDPARVGPPAPRAYRAVVLENDYVAVTLLPELGGRIYRWVDKATGRNLLYNNPVIKPTQWGYRGWWLAAGGIEWTFPVEEHGLNEWRPWEYSVGYAAHELAVTVQDREERTGMRVGATISLDADHAYVTLQPWARNESSEEQPYQLWLNAMLTLGGNAVSEETRFVIPADRVVVHSTGDGALPGAGGALTWPHHGGRDLSRYGSWGGYLGFFVPPGAVSFVGLYDPVVEQGMVRVTTPGWPAGTKFFGPAGLPPSLWTDDGSDYVELWSGATATFRDYAVLAPGGQVGWTERWYPVHGLGGVTAANADAALFLADEGREVAIGVMATSQIVGEVVLWIGGEPAERWEVSLAPGHPFAVRTARDTGRGVGLSLVNLGGETIVESGAVP